MYAKTEEVHAIRKNRNRSLSIVAFASFAASMLLSSTIVGFNYYLTSLRLAANQKWGPNQLVETLKIAKLQKRFSRFSLPEIRRHATLSLAESAFTMATPVNVLTGHTGKVTGIAFHPMEEKIATSSRDKTVRLWGFDV